MKDATTAQSMRAALGYFILTNVWFHLQGHAEAVAIVERLKTQLMGDADNTSYLAMRGVWGWNHIDLTGWGEELDSELPEASCEGCGERLSCCQCDGNWNHGPRATYSCGCQNRLPPSETRATDRARS